MKKIVAIMLIGLFLTGCTVEEVSQKPFISAGADITGSTENNQETPSTKPKPEHSEGQQEEEMGRDVAKYANPLDFFSQPRVNFGLFTPQRDIKGIYMGSNKAGISTYMEPALELIDSTELNAVVIDVKRDDGFISFRGLEKFDELGLSKQYIPDMPSFVADLNTRGIHTIARIVTFKDLAVVDVFPEYVIKLDDGSLYKEGNLYWLDPYNRDVWEYVLEIAEGAAKMGFREIQFDYIRFSTDKNIKRAMFNNPDNKEKTEIIAEFAAYAMERLKPYNVMVSADVYGISIVSDFDARNIGQDYEELSQIFDVICPMVYPSHYANGSFGIPYPDLDPYNVIKETMKVSTEKLNTISEQGIKVAVVRPWLQAFTASYLKVNYQNYGGAQIREQIQACYDTDVAEWLLWDASNNYFADGLEATSLDPKKR